MHNPAISICLGTDDTPRRGAPLMPSARACPSTFVDSLPFQYQTVILSIRSLFFSLLVLLVQSWTVSPSLL